MCEEGTHNGQVLVLIPSLVLESCLVRMLGSQTITKPNQIKSNQTKPKPNYHQQKPVLGSSF